MVPTIPRLVRYDPVFLRRVVVVLTAMTIFFVYIGFITASTAGIKAKLFSAVLFACAAFLAPMILFGFLPRLITKNPVLAITDEGLLIDYLILEKAMMLPWSAIESIRSIEGQICLILFDTNLYLRERPFWSQWIYLAEMARYGTFFRLSPIAFDIGTDEFMNLVPARLRVSQPPGFSGSSPTHTGSTSSFDDYFRTLKLYKWVRQNPVIKLKTVEDYVHQFSRNLVGSWSNDNAKMPSPMTQDVVFDEDGTGYVAAAFFTGYSGKFEWREKSVRLIEVCSVDESPTWFQLGWDFGGGDSPKLYLWEPDSNGEDTNLSENSELISCLLCDPLYLADRRSWGDSPRLEEIPSDAEEISIGGETAWISSGPTHWKLHLGARNVTVANISEDGKDCHFFSLDFISQVSGDHFTGTFDHAPGHVNRQEFLVLAKRIIQGIRTV